MNENGQPMVKVTNTELHVTTVWSMEKYQAKFEEMQDAHSTWRQDRQLPDGVRELFFNPDDAWTDEVADEVKAMILRTFNDSKKADKSSWGLAFPLLWYPAAYLVAAQQYFSRF